MNQKPILRRTHHDDHRRIVCHSRFDKPGPDPLQRACRGGPWRIWERQISRQLLRPSNSRPLAVLPAAESSRPDAGEWHGRRRANLIVYQPHAIAPKELATLFEHVASVQGKVILCDNREALAISYPELSDAVARSLSRAIPHELSKALSPSPSTEKHEERDVREHTLTLPDRPTPKDKPYVPSTDALSQFDLPREGRSYLLYHTATDKPSDFPDGYRLVAKIRADNIYRALADSQHFGSAS